MPHRLISGRISQHSEDNHGEQRLRGRLRPPVRQLQGVHAHALCRTGMNGFLNPGFPCLCQANQSKIGESTEVLPTHNNKIDLKREIFLPDEKHRCDGVRAGDGLRRERRQRPRGDPAPPRSSYALRR